MFFLVLDMPWLNVELYSLMYNFCQLITVHVIVSDLLVSTSEIIWKSLLDDKALRI